MPFSVTAVVAAAAIATAVCVVVDSAAGAVCPVVALMPLPPFHCLAGALAKPAETVLGSLLECGWVKIVGASRNA